MVHEPVEQALLELHRIEGDDLPAALDVIAHLITSALEPVRWSSITILSVDGQPDTVAYRGRQALAADEAQYRAGAGPCLRAAEINEPIVIDDVRSATEWPAFVGAAVQQGILSSVSAPFAVRSAPAGALNLYSDELSAFSSADQAAAVNIALHTGLAVANQLRVAASEENAMHLRAALESRDVIGQAKGILMRTHLVSANEAFDMLRIESQRENIKLREVAERVARTGHLPPHD